MGVITIVSVYDDLFMSLNDETLKGMMRDEFEVPDDEIEVVLNDVKQNLLKLMFKGKLEIEDCVPIFSVCHHVLRKFVIKEYTTTLSSNIILNINHIN